MDKHNLLHPPLPVKNLKKNEEVLLIHLTKDEKFDVAFLDADFKPVPKSMIVPVKDFSKFLDSSVCQNLKAVFFLLVDYNNMSLTINLKIRQMVYEEARKRKWHIYLVDPIIHSIMPMLFASKIDSKPGDVILNVIYRCLVVSVFELHRRQEGYSYFGRRKINPLNRSFNDVAAEILGNYKPQYVTVCDSYGSDLMMSLKSRFIPSKNVIYIDTVRMVECIPQVLKAIFDYGCDQIIPFCMDTHAVTNVSNFTAPEHAVVTVDEYEDLPLEKIQIVPKSKKPYSVAYLDLTSERYMPAAEALISKEQGLHRIKLALVVDRNSLPFLYQEPFIIPEIEALPQTLASQPGLNVPVIGFFDNSSIICVRDENGYMFLNEWKGLYGNDLYLTFEPEVPTIVTNLNNVNDKDPFVVYDLVKVLSMPADDLKIDPKWGFKVTSNSDNAVLLEVETFLGSRKATPFLLMFYFIKLHIKAIEKETGKKPNELGFCLFDHFTDEEKKRIQNGLEEACNLLEIGFVFVSNV